MRYMVRMSTGLLFALYATCCTAFASTVSSWPISMVTRKLPPRPPGPLGPYVVEIRRKQRERIFSRRLDWLNHVLLCNLRDGPVEGDLGLPCDYVQGESIPNDVPDDDEPRLDDGIVEEVHHAPHKRRIRDFVTAAGLQ